MALVVTVPLNTMLADIDETLRSLLGRELERHGFDGVVLGEPGLRRRARAQCARRLSGGPSDGDFPVLARSSLFGVAWSVVAALFAIAMTFRNEETLGRYAPAEWIVWAVLATWIAVPVLVVVGRPLVRRLRGAA